VQPAETAVNLTLSGLLSHASPPVQAIAVVLLAASTSVWFVGVLKLAQVHRLRRHARAFEKRVQGAQSGRELLAVVHRGGESAGVRLLQTMLLGERPLDVAHLRAIAERSLVEEQQRARKLMPVLGSIGSAAPFVGLLGTVYGIMDAFVRIGAAKSASLPVVAPAIGEALITTAIGLAAAIPAVLFYNSAEQAISDFLAEIEASAAAWIAILSVDWRLGRAAAPHAEADEPLGKG
jgi:biopolymer transport protein TolQ